VSFTLDDACSPDIAVAVGADSSEAFARDSERSAASGCAAGFALDFFCGSAAARGC
jgi:hypothetical protein